MGTRGNGMARIYVVNGTGGVGKDTFVDFCLRILGDRARKMSTVDLVKEIATMLGWDGTKNEKNRKFLSDLKDLLTKWGDIPWKDIQKKISEFEIKLRGVNIDPDTGAVFIFSREPAELKRFRDELNARIILVTNPRVPLIQSNHADAEVLDFDYDVTIDNNSDFEDLYKKAIGFIESEEL